MAIVIVTGRMQYMMVRVFTNACNKKQRRNKANAFGSECLATSATNGQKLMHTNTQSFSSLRPPFCTCEHIESTRGR